MRPDGRQDLDRGGRGGVVRAAQEPPRSGEPDSPGREPLPAAVEDGPDDPVAMPRWQRRLVTAAILLTAVCVLSSVMPASGLKADVGTVTGPLLGLTGLDQGWGVFAPNPRPSTDHVIARVERADGSHVDVAMPTGRLLDEYWDYRWAKVDELLGLVDGATTQRAAFALWAANQVRGPGPRPTRVTLIRRSTPNLPPGPGPATGPTHDTAVFTATVNGS